MTPAQAGTPVCKSFLSAQLTACIQCSTKHQDDITLAKTVECLGKLKGGKKKGEKQQTYTDAIWRHTSTREGMAGSWWLRRDVLLQWMLLCSHDNQCPFLQLSCNRQTSIESKTEWLLAFDWFVLSSLRPPFALAFHLNMTWSRHVFTCLTEETDCIEIFLCHVCAWQSALH